MYKQHDFISFNNPDYSYLHFLFSNFFLLLLKTIRVTGSLEKGNTSLKTRTDQQEARYDSIISFQNQAIFKSNKIFSTIVKILNNLKKKKTYIL